MSTYIYLLCRDHNPAIQADGESGQHLTDWRPARCASRATTP